MKCNNTRCQWHGFGYCCPESEEMYNKAIPNSLDCPHYFDLDAAVEKEHREAVAFCRQVLECCGVKNSDKIIDELDKCKGMEFIKYYDQIFDLYESKRLCDSMDRMFAEINEIGVEAFKQKYLIEAE